MRVALLFSSPLELDVYTCFVELVSHAKVVSRSTSFQGIAHDFESSAIDVLLAEARLIDSTGSKQLAEIAKTSRLQIGVVSPQATIEFDTPYPLIELTDSHCLLRLLAGKSATEPSDKASPQDVQLPALTRREREVWQLISTGQSVRSIAATLNLAESTIDSHKSRLMRKLKVHKSVDLVRLAARLGMIET